MSGQRKPLHPAKAKDVVKALSKLGFVARHTKGAHVFLKRAAGRTTTVPIHSREEIDRRLLRKIAADVGIHPEEIMYLVNEAWGICGPGGFSHQIVSSLSPIRRG